MKTQPARVAAVQFAAGTDALANKAKVLEMLEKARELAPDLIVTPEFSNHASWYEHQDHCYEVSLTLEDDLIRQVAAFALSSRCLVVLNVTLRRAAKTVSGSSILFDREGQIIGISDKQVLMGHETYFLTPGQEKTPIFKTDIGQIGLYACMDGVIPETPRDLAVRGAEILCNSLNSFARDEADLHIPVRAAENKVFVVAANKVGPLVPPKDLKTIAASIHIPEHFLYGAGESQIVAPDGTVLSKASLYQEEVVWADIDVAMARQKTRPSGTDIFKSRRPDVYRALYKKSIHTDAESASKDGVTIAVWQGLSDKAHLKDTLDELATTLPKIAERADILLLPELFWVKDLNGPHKIHALLEESSEVLSRLKKYLAGLPLMVCSSFLIKRPEGVMHSAVLMRQDQILLEQPEIHEGTILQKSDGRNLEQGLDLRSMTTPFGRIGLITGRDAIYPELFRLHALQDVDLVLIPGHIEEGWELETGFLERSAESRLALAVATRPSVAGASAFYDLEEDFTLMTPWKKRTFDGRINWPHAYLVARHAGLTYRTLHPQRARNKILSAETHLLRGMPGHFFEAL